MKKPNKMMRGGMANAASRAPAQAGAGLARAAEMSGRAVWPRGMKKGGKVDGVAKKGKTKGRKC